MVKNKLGLIHLGRSGAGPLFLVEMAKALKKLGEIPTIISNPEILQDYPDLEIDFEFSTYVSQKTLVLNFPKAVSRAFKLRMELKKRELRYIISPMESIYQSLLIPIWLPRNIKYVSLIHDGELHPGKFNLLFKLMRYLEIRRANLLVVLSDASRGEVMKRSPKKVLLTPLPFLDFGDPDSVTEPLQSRGLSMLFFGRLEPYKGLQELLEAMRIVGTGNVSNVSLIIAGSGPEVRLKEFYTQRNVYWLSEWIPDEEIPNLFNSADLVILPYIQASQSGVISIAHRYGVPVAITPVGGLKEQIDLDFDLQIGSASVQGISSFLDSLSKGEVVPKRRAMVSSEEVNGSWRRLVEGPLRELGYFDETI